MKSRKERKEEARNNGLKFEPSYNGRVITKEQYDKEVLELKEKSKIKTETRQETSVE